MRMLRAAAVVAVAVGLGLFAVGCGPEPGQPTTGDTGKGKDAKPTGDKKDDGKTPADPDKGKKDIDGKAKEFADSVSKDVAAIDAAINKSLGDAIAAEKDANKKGPLKKLQVEAGTELKEVQDGIKGLSGQKDLAALDAAKADLTKKIDALKAKLKDHIK